LAIYAVQQFRPKACIISPLGYCIMFVYNRGGQLVFDWDQLENFFNSRSTSH